MIQDSSTVMLGHYFKKRRQLVEIFFCSSTGLGLAIVSLSTSYLLRLATFKEIFTFRTREICIEISLSELFVLGPSATNIAPSCDSYVYSFFFQLTAFPWHCFLCQDRRHGDVPLWFGPALLFLPKGGHCLGLNRGLS